MNEEQERNAPPAEKKKRKVGFKIKMALLEVIERKRLSNRVDYKAVAARHGMSTDALRQVYHQWSRNEVDMGEPQTKEELEIDARVQHERKLQLLKRYEALILNGVEGLLLEAEDEATKGSPMHWQANGLRDCVRELKAIGEIRNATEKGYMAILEELIARSNIKPANPQLAGNGTTVDIQAKVVRANDEQMAMAALDGHEPAATRS